MSVNPAAGQPKKPDAPRRVRHGIKFRRKNGLEELPWTARTFVQSVQEKASLGAQVLGMEYALSGQAASFSVDTGAVEALVQGRAFKPYTVRISLKHLTPEQWAEVVQLMAKEAVFAAKLLVGEMPIDIEEVFEEREVQLLPRGWKDLKVECDCGEKNPCKHIVAVTYLLVERIEVDPLVLFALRGLPGTKLLERLQEARNVHSAGVSQSHQSAQLPSQKAKLPPLESCLNDYWRPGRKLAEFEALPAQEHIPHAVLRRLGASPLGGKFPLVGLLASVQDSLRAKVIELRQRIEDGTP
ncbi:MAG: SWIM zinc finger family protein [Planctomycetes bacterium]|nr:SWIM zinc finger family protein [Planctomycetota bacterium]